MFFTPGGSFISPPLQLDSGAYIEREFTAPNVPESMRDVLFAGDVTHPARPRRGNQAPTYPRSLAAAGVRGIVNALFVVSEDGKPEMETLQFLSSSDGAFDEAVRHAIERWHFEPADLDGRKVRQVVQESFDFGLPGDPPRGDVIIRTMLAPHSGGSH
ncbi:MAG TPA: energy transducer TonB [Gemmatimonadaceae bacterium]|nr:energy transducer TonB [Gemmatimonadaceae bacterium]